MSADANGFEDGDLGVAGMTLDEYHRMGERIESEGRDAYSSDELARFDAAHEEYVEVGRRMQTAIASQLPDLSAALKRAGDVAAKSGAEAWKAGEDESVRAVAMRQWEPPQVDDELLDSLADAKQEERARQVAQVDALELIAGHLAEVKAEQQETSAAVRGTTSEVESLRADERKSGHWTVGLGVVSAVAASVAAVFAVLVYLYPPG